jgi:hypothetical protein
VSAVTALQGEIVDRLPFEEYIGLEGVHATGLKDMHVSPLLYRRRRDVPRQDADFFRVGRATHTATLEPLRFLKEYVLWPKSNGRRFGKKWNEFREQAGARTILTEAQYELATRLSEAVRSHKVAGKYLAERGRAELTIRWQHPRTGVRCVSRIDWLCSVVGDLKATRNPSPGKFSTDAARLGYALQMAFYADAVAAAGFGALQTKLFAVQNVEPFDVVVFDVDEETLRIGREQYENALDKLIECERSGEWPGLAGDEEVKLRLPAWATAEADDPLTFNGAPLFGDAPEDE